MKITLSPDVLATLDQLVQATGAPDRATLVRDALHTMAWLLRSQDAGKHVVILTPADIRVLETSDVLDGPRDVLVPLRERSQE